MRNLSSVDLKILDTLRIRGILTRAQLSRITGLSQTKVADVSRRLVKMGLARETEGPSSGGRKPTLLQIEGSICYTVGIDVGTQNLRAVMIDARGNTVASVRNHRPLPSDRQLDVEDMLSLMKEVLAQTDIAQHQVGGIGVGVTGIVDEINGTCLFVPGAQQWRQLPVVRLLQQATRMPNVCLTDSVRAMALAESRYGLGRGLADFVVVNVGVGLGVGMVINGTVVTGSRGIVGELGHIYVGKSDEICCCGNYGCLESIASGWALARRVTKAMANGVITSIQAYPAPSGTCRISDVIEAAKSGDKFAVNLLDETADYLSIGVSTLANLLNPQRIIIGGGLAEGAGDVLMEPLIRRTKARSLPWIQSEIDIRLSELGEYGAARGAATLAMDKVFSTVDNFLVASGAVSASCSLRHP